MLDDPQQLPPSHHDRIAHAIRDVLRLDVGLLAWTDGRIVRCPDPESIPDLLTPAIIVYPVLVERSYLTSSQTRATVRVEVVSLWQDDRTELETEGHGPASVVDAISRPLGSRLSLSRVSDWQAVEQPLGTIRGIQVTDLQSVAIDQRQREQFSLLTRMVSAGVVPDPTLVDMRITGRRLALQVEVEYQAPNETLTPDGFDVGAWA